jgi:cytochrome P450
MTRNAEIDPFALARRESGVMLGDFHGEAVPMLLRHRDVRAAAKDIATYSSDAPFRVPVPSEESVRTVRQLPIETDPPEHTEYRAIVAPLFLRAANSDYRSAIDAMVDEALSTVATGGPVDIVPAFALPLQCRALTLLLGVPAAEADEWIGWGEHVFKDAGGLNPDKGRALDDYIERAFLQAYDFPEPNLFRTLLDAEYRGRRLTSAETRGFANLAFAGGRDTVINALAGAMVHFTLNPQDLDRLRAEPRLVNTAAEELVRFLSPITHLGRVCSRDVTHGEFMSKAGTRVALCWASANRDEAVFDRSEDFIIDRNPNPHLGFGSGAHSCLGAAHARTLLRSLLVRLADRHLKLSVVELEPAVKEWPHYSRQTGYAKAVLRLCR